MRFQAVTPHHLSGLFTTPASSSGACSRGRHDRQPGDALGVRLLLDPAHPVRYGNHSCAPTLWHRGATTLIARRDITPGEELTIDYATHTGVVTWSMNCRCGSSLCRSIVTGDDWRLPQLQAAYGTHWSPPLLDRIKSAGRRAND
ncbi:SET domain-containing protein-lysine N-methyltransferase [Nonomuraea typhae]|uniref:SET domain-containing protein-lysine N-methyltransferase n=1 Tax=Nonomuraea typhae TaxID=2603600 RepID=UPI0012FAFBD7|nr:SET domain-containing protein-lysine N-methyltransferase [Nonomuraea typhae]